ncbi:uncharacterized protein [Procambarus clarkii]|uniref:uncharacterized protein n=1 Tax=Procambarus clarkii TaxID=6728 RepID=UPI0037447C93
MCIKTHYPEGFALRNIRAKTVVALMLQFCSIFGLPRVVQTDNRTNFKSDAFEQFCKDNGITQKVSSPYHPQSQGTFQREEVQSLLDEFFSLFREVPTQTDAICHDVKLTDYTLYSSSTLPDVSGNEGHRAARNRLPTPARPYPAEPGLLVLTLPFGSQTRRLLAIVH